MKNPVSLFSFRSPRHQRGFLRVTGAILSLGLVGIGGLTVRQVKAYHHSAAKPPIVAAKSSAKGCGCGPVASGKHQHKSSARNASYEQDVSDVSDGTDNYDQAVSLQAGQRLKLGVSDPTGAIQPNGIWKPGFGTVDADGIYTAPSFTPPEGLDNVQYTDANGNDVFINVRILPNPSLSGSDQTPATTFDYTAVSDPAQPIGQPIGQPVQPVQPGAAQAQNGQSAVPLQAIDDGTQAGPFVPDTETVVVLPGEAPAPPEQIINSVPLVGRTINGVNVLVLPARTGGDGTTSAIYAQPLDGAATQVSLLPNIKYPTGKCTPGAEKSEYAPYTVTVKPLDPSVNLGDFKIDAGAKADIAKAFGINLSIGAVFHVQGRYYDWKRTHIKYD